MKQPPEQEYFLKNPDIEENNPAKPATLPKKLIFSVFTLTSLFWLAIILILRLPQIYPPTPPSPPTPSEPQRKLQNITSDMTLLTCGTTPQKAKRLGCKYDISLNAWLHPRCYTQSFIDAYRTDNTWDAYTDRTLEEPLTLTHDQLGSLRTYYTTERDHVNHCVNLWRRQFRLLFERSEAIDAVSAGWKHMWHCGEFLLGLGYGDDDRSRVTDVWPEEVGCWVRRREGGDGMGVEKTGMGRTDGKMDVEGSGHGY